MMRRKLIEKIKKSVNDWAKQYPQVELLTTIVYPSGIGNNLHVIVVAEKGFENWRDMARHKDLLLFLRKSLGDADFVKIPVLLTLTEEQFEKYEITNETPAY